MWPSPQVLGVELRRAPHSAPQSLRLALRSGRGGGFPGRPAQRPTGPACPPTSAASFSAPPGSPDAPKAASLPRTEAALWREAESRLYLPQASGSKRARTPQVKYIIAIL